MTGKCVDNTLLEDLSLLLQEYFDRHVDMRHINPLLNQIEKNGNHAFRNNLPEACVLTPIAAHQEPREFVENTLHLLAEQAQQPGAPNFNVILSCNAPRLENDDYKKNFTSTIETIKTFQAKEIGKQLPLSFFTIHYPPDTTIGKIRKDLWDTVIYRLWDQFARDIPEPMVMFNIDIDVTRMSRLCISRLNDAIHQGYSYAVANKRYDRTRDEAGRSIYPNLDRAVAMQDLDHAINPEASYDCHNAYNLRVYLAAEGFSPEDSVYEVHNLRVRAVKVMGDTFKSPPFVQIPGTIVVSPPRRPYDKYRQNIPLGDFWKPGEFGMTDSYRGASYHGPDITPEAAAALIDARVQHMHGLVRDQIAKWYLQQGLSEEVAKQKATDRVVEILRIARVIIK